MWWLRNTATLSPVTTEKILPLFMYEQYTHLIKRMRELYKWKLHVINADDFEVSFL